MFVASQSPSAQRRGVILLVVLALLTLFSIIGITFVLYAEATATEARLAREAEQTNRPDMNPEDAFALFLGQLIYDAPDDATGVYSALRGHSLARTMYGYGYTPGSAGTPNDKPFCGPGRLNDSASLTVAGVPNNNNSNLVNFTYFPSGIVPLRDPERPGPRPGGSVGTLSLGNYVAANVPYTYPDVQNMFLAAVNADGTVLSPSYHRSWLFNQLSNQGNPNWTNAVGRYLTLRPRPADNSSAFPYPDEDGGDVQNLVGNNGGNDSIWIDMGAPIMIAPDGRKFKMLVAPLVLDLDNRINLVTAGNLLNTNAGTGQSATHASNSGWGPYSVNLSKVMNATTAPNEWKNIMLGNSPATAGSQRVFGKYGSNQTPDSTAVASGSWPRGYAQVDFNEIIEAVAGAASAGLPTGPMDFPGKVYAGGYTAPAGYTLPKLSSSTQAFPNFGPNTYGFNNGAGNNGMGVDERTNHPLNFNILRAIPGASTTYTALGAGTGDDRLFPASNMASLLRVGGNSWESEPSDLLRLCPKNFINRKICNMVTTHSFDLDRPGVTPYVWADPSTTYQYNAVTGPNGSAQGYPTASAGSNFPALSTYGTLTSTEFDPTSWRSLLGAVLKVDLNRTLPDYNAPTANFSFDAAGQTQFAIATQARQVFAKDIFDRLRQAVGAPDPTVAATAAAQTANSQDFQTLRWLAQLAVNIVDFIDADDIMTPFPWNTPYVGMGSTPETVFGTEVPRLVINEVYAQYDNNKADLKATPTPPRTTDYNVNVWVELHNPLTGMPGNSITSQGTTFGSGYVDNGWAVLQNDKGPVYQLFVNDITVPPAAVMSNLRATNNTTGNPDTGAGVLSSVTWPPTSAANLMNWGSSPTIQSQTGMPPDVSQYVQPTSTAGAFNDTSFTNVGFYVVAPITCAPQPNTSWVYPATAVPNIDPAFNNTYPNTSYQTQTSALTYTVPKATADTVLPQPTVFLQRLACPYMPWQNSPTAANYNPYITVDYVERIPVNDSRLVNSTNTALTPPAMTARNSWGKRQPYASVNNISVATNSNSTPLPTYTSVGMNSTTQLGWILQPQKGTVPGQVQATFYRHNYDQSTAPPGPPGTVSNDQTLKMPFDWLVHLDRQLLSPMELLNVSAYKPHELTQVFASDNPGGTAWTPRGHLARWTDQTTRLARFFELAETKCRSAGVALGGRIPGKPNINTIWNVEILKAVLDAQVGNSFWNSVGDSDANVETVFSQIMSVRSPTTTSIGGTNYNVPGGTDSPFLGLATGWATASATDPLSTSARGVDNTLLQQYPAFPMTPPTTPTQLIEDPTTAPTAVMNPYAHPYQRFEMLTKLFNNVTNRSNVFAVYLTVGFFEVTNDAVRPATLGAEIGRSENRQVRHHMFAIVDRTELQVFTAVLPNGTTITPGAINGSTLALTPQALPTLSSYTDPATGNTWTVNGTTVTDSRTGASWTIGQNTVLTIEPDTDYEETVVVGAGNMVTFTKNHPDSHNTTGAPIKVTCRGNPGPWTRYDPRKDPNVVLFWTVID